MFKTIIILAVGMLLILAGATFAQDRTGTKFEKPALAKLQERTDVYVAQTQAANKYRVSAEPGKNAFTGKPKPEVKKIPKAVPVADTLREEMRNSVILGGGYLYQRVDDLPIDRVQGVAVGGFYYPVSWIGFGGEYQYGRGSATSTIGNTTRQDKLTRNVGVFGPEFSGYPGDNVRLFFHPLVGWAKEKMTTRIGNTTSTTEDTNFATNLGGGMDLRITRSLAWRVFQFDYLGIKRPSFWQNNWRLSTGVAVRAH